MPGSPPPMRGKVPAIQAGFGWLGITPAYAGKSSEPENCDMNNQGSPPPMRGKAPVSHISNNFLGITPAYAGKRETPKGCVEHGGDHPRLCGEKF